MTDGRPRARVIEGVLPVGAEARPVRRHRSRAGAPRRSAVVAALVLIVWIRAREERAAGRPRDARDDHDGAPRGVGYPRRSRAAPVRRSSASSSLADTRATFRSTRGVGRCGSRARADAIRRASILRVTVPTASPAGSIGWSRSRVESSTMRCKGDRVMKTTTHPQVA